MGILRNKISCGEKCTVDGLEEVYEEALNC